MQVCTAGHSLEEEGTQLVALDNSDEIWFVTLIIYVYLHLR